MNDRAFQTGDTLILERWHEMDGGAAYPTHNELRVTVSYILQGGQFGVEARWCVMGIVGVEILEVKTRGGKR